MAIHGVSWVPGAHVRFRNLDFIVTTEGGLVQAPAEALEDEVPRLVPPFSKLVPRGQEIN